MAQSKRQVTPSIRLVRGPIKGISEFKMSNGLKILLMPDHSSPVVTSIVMYRVGSRNEGPGNTGSAHFFEHLMFKGSRRFNQDLGNNIDELTKYIGANLNAYTAQDQTVYHVQASSEHLELCLAIEADRMRGLRMKKADRDSEMTVVRNEMEQGENWPQQAMYKQLMATAYTQHPYHHDVIGSRSEVENVPLENMRAFYNTYYWPNNAVLIVVGDFEQASALAFIEKHFGRISRSPHKIPDVYTVEPRQEGERRFEVRRVGGIYQLAFGYHIPEARHADMPALELLSQILGSSWSRSSRLYKRLVDTGLAYEVYGFAYEMRDPGLFMAGVNLNETTTVAEAEAAMLEVIETLRTDLVGEEEFERIKSGNRKSKILQLAESKYFGYALANAEALYGDWRHFLDRLDAFEAVTAEDIRRVALKYLTKDNRTVGVFVPKSAEEAEAEKSERAVEEPAPLQARPKNKVRSLRKADPEAVAKTITRFTGKTPKRQPIAERIVRRVLANGLTVQVLKEKPGTGSVAISASVLAGNYFESEDKQNLADIVASMLPMGSRGLTREQLADELITMGVHSGLHMFVGPFRGGITSHVLSEDARRYLEIVSTVLRHSVFDDAEIATVKNQWNGRYREEMEFPGSVAQNTLGNVLYPQDVMFHQKTLPEQLADLERMTRDDLVEFHGRVYVPSATTITIVGDIEPDAAVELVKEIFGDWSGPVAPPIVVPEPPTRAPETFVKKMIDKPGVELVFGRALPLKKTDPDWQAAVLALKVLGGDTLTSRLGKRLREENGLTYGVHAYQWDQSYGGAPWSISLSVNAQNVDRAVAMVREILDDFVENGISERELNTQVSNMIGEHNLHSTTIFELAGKIAEASAIGADLNSIDGYADELRKLTVDDVNQAIRRYFSGENLVTVIAGDV